MHEAIFPSFLWRLVGRIISDDQLERAFYIIGLAWRGILIIYDLVEFKYIERNKTHVIGDPHQKALLIQAIPPGLKLLGILHSHPFDKGKPDFSTIDLRDFSNFGNGLFIVLSGSLEYNAVFMSGRESKECHITIRELRDHEKPRILIVNNRWKLIVPMGLSKWELEKYAPIHLSEAISREVILGRIKVSETSADLALPDYFDVIKSWNPFKIPYRLYLQESTEDVLNEIKLIIRYIFNYKDCELILHKDEREAVIHKCDGRYI